MPLTLSKQQLSKAVSSVIAGRPKKFTVPWHEWMLMDFDGEFLTLATGDSTRRCWNRVRIPDAGCVPFRIAVKATELQSICSVTRSETLTISHDGGNKINIVGDRGRLCLACTEEWPELPSIAEAKDAAKINAASLSYAFRAALSATDDASDRYVLDAIHVSISKEDGCLVQSTDGRMLIRIQLAGTAIQDAQFLVPGDAVSLICGVLSAASGDSDVFIRDDGNNVIFACENGVAYVTQKSGNYPKGVNKIIADIIGKKPAFEAEIETGTFVSAVREATIGYEVSMEWSRETIVISDGSAIKVMSSAHSPNDIVVNVPGQPVGKGVIIVDHTMSSMLVKSSNAERVTVSARATTQDGVLAFVVQSGDYTGVLMSIAPTYRDEKTGKHVYTESAKRGAAAVEANLTLV